VCGRTSRGAGTLLQAGSSFNAGRLPIPRPPQAAECVDPGCWIAGVFAFLGIHSPLKRLPLRKLPAPDRDAGPGEQSPALQNRNLYGLAGTLVWLRASIGGRVGAFCRRNPMSAAYPLHLEREIDRRWLHRPVSIDRPVPPDRPKHPNDLWPVRKHPDDGTRPAPESQNSRGGD